MTIWVHTSIKSNYICGTRKFNLKCNEWLVRADGISFPSPSIDTALFDLKFSIHIILSMQLISSNTAFALCSYVNLCRNNT